MSKIKDYKKTDTILTLAGFDGTGGAGLNIDIKICSLLKVQNVSVITSVVIQSPFEVIKKIDIKTDIIKEQLFCLKKYYNTKVVNIGLLGSPEILDFVIKEFENSKIIFDPIFSSGSGKFIFLKKKEINYIKDRLKFFYLVTPNLPEAEILSGEEIKTFEEIKGAVKIIKNKFGIKNILIKGGHFKSNSSFDLLLNQNNFYRFKSQLTDFKIHGTGSFLNAAISAYIFKGESLRSSILKSKILLKKAINNTDKNHPILNI